MQRYFLYFYILVLAFVGCDINDLEVIRYYDACVAIVFLSLSFMMLNLVGVCEGKENNISIGKSELFLFLFLAWSAVTFYSSVNPEITIFPAIKCLGALAFGIGLFLYLEKRGKLVEVWLLSYTFASIHASLGVLERFFILFLPENLTVYSSVVGSESLFTNQNYYSCYLLLHIPVGIYLYFKTPTSLSKNLIGLGWIIILVALGVSESLAAQLIAALQIGASVLYFLVHKKPQQAKLVSLTSFIAFIIFMGLIRLIPEGNASAPEIVMSAPVGESDWLSNHVGLRLRYWLAGWRIFCDHWLFGSGLWTYYEVFPYTGLLEVYDKPIYNMVPSHAHSFYFQTLAETGLIGIVLLLSCLVFLFRSNIKLLIEKKQETLDLNFFLLVSTVGYLIHNISEYNWLNSLFVYYFVLLIVSMGYLSRVNSLQPYGLISLRKVFVLPTVLILVFLIGYAEVYFYQHYQIKLKPVNLRQTKDEYENQLNLAKTLCESCSGPRYLSGLAKLGRYRITKKNKFLDEAQKEFSEALVRNVYNPKINMLQGDIYLLQGNKKDARQSYKMAMKHPWFTLQAQDKLNTFAK